MNDFVLIVDTGIPVISPVVGFSVNPSGRGVLVCMKNSVMMLRYDGAPLDTSVPMMNSMLLFR